MSIATLDDIIIKVRKLTGSATSNQLSDAQIIDYINSFYLYDFPAQFRSLKLKDRYTFNTQRGIDTYPFDSEHYTTIEMPCYVAKREVQLFQDPASFFAVWFNWQYQETLAQGNGSNGGVNGPITAITLANPLQVTSPLHGRTTGDVIAITGIVGTTALNNLFFTITVVNANNFTLDGIDGTDPIYQAYLSGGFWTFGAYSCTTTAHPLIRSTRNNPRVETRLVPTTNFDTDPRAVTTAFPSTNIGRVQNILITANLTYGTSLIVTDDGAGNLIGDCLQGGFIDYETGEVISLIFTQPVPSGNNITIEYNPANPPNLAIPQAIMFFQNQFTLRPVPDKGYTVELVAYRLPSQVLLGSVDPNAPTGGTPELNEWWETIAFGAAKKVYEDRLDPDGVALMDKSLTERYALNETRTYAQLGTQQMSTLFRGHLSHNYGNSGWGWGS